MKSTTSKFLSHLAIGLLVIPFASNATQDNLGYNIAAKADRSDRGFEVSSVDLKMRLIDKKGQETERLLTMKTMEVADEDKGDKSLIIFNSPADVKETKLLSHAQIIDADDQWLYLPALKRVKRISSANKSGPFVGSEFAFEDFTAQELNKYSYEYVSEEACGELTCAVIDRFPKYENSGYTKQRALIDTKDYQVRKIDFYDRKGSHLKTLSLDNYKLYQQAYWRPLTMTMENHQSGKKTILEFSDYQFDIALSARDFIKSSLK
ncbi:outer membrane lipoprotein-sorting protein [Pseudoalteromonas piscicida]|uniref:Outer membrane lipoprotein-sorting protein n=1 Tax=Pseudoalteromonas piscicida TaxID=43662 RepID=A0AAD0W3G2_PSEO7|nr:outer membrane lipoprotein-sorting protein [Pseudoalteromonas piscicida]ASD68223.1 outer membrane lipoprotein-sorting protein [Pseudoalteromonas piscicida]AXQ99161.1 outer membrane lipoprotein-sorting protein [Pseudoalteromonas piscicida]AXR01068.1 outer membrane lipoprotein-sorting protein [Pseudoalteromonas piscicida]